MRWHLLFLSVPVLSSLNITLFLQVLLNPYCIFPEQSSTIQIPCLGFRRHAMLLVNYSHTSDEQPACLSCFFFHMSFEIISLFFTITTGLCFSKADLDHFSCHYVVTIIIFSSFRYDPTVSAVSKHLFVKFWNFLRVYWSWKKVCEFLMPPWLCPITWCAILVESHKISWSPLAMLVEIRRVCVVPVLLKLLTKDTFCCEFLLRKNTDTHFKFV